MEQYDITINPINKNVETILDNKQNDEDSTGLSCLCCCCCYFLSSLFVSCIE